MLSEFVHGRATRRQFLSSAGAAAVALQFSPGFTKIAASARQSSWALSSAAAMDGGYWAIAADTDHVGLFQLEVDRRSTVRLGSLVEVGVEPGFHPQRVAAHAGRLVIIGDREREGEHQSQSPGLADLRERDPAAVELMSPWQLAAFEEWLPTVEFETAAYAVDASGAAEDLQVPTFGNRFGACVAISSRGDGGLCALLGGSSNVDGLYVDNLALATRETDGAWSTEPVASDLGESVNYEVTVQDQTPLVLFTPQDGGLRSWTPVTGNRNLQSGQTLLGAGLATDGSVLAASVDRSGEVRCDRVEGLRTRVRRTRRDAVTERLHVQTERPVFVPVDDTAPGKFIAGSNDEGLRLVTV